MAVLPSRQIFTYPMSGLRSARDYLSRFYRKPHELTPQELMEREEFYRMVIEQSRDAVLLLSQEGVVEFVNPAAEELLCLEADQLLGQKFEYPVRENLRQEVCVSRPGEKTLVVDMRVTEAGQKGKRYYLVQFRDITELVRLREELRILSLTDELTGLYNRRAFTLLAKQQIKLADRKKLGMYLFFIDIDGMKRINDTLGHKAGDAVLETFAEALRRSFRSSDLIMRMGGDEFMVLAIDSHPDSRELLVRRLHETLEEVQGRRKMGHAISFSMGTVRYDPKAPHSIEELVEQADKLMYREKCEKSGAPLPDAAPLKPVKQNLWDLLSLENLVPGKRLATDRSRAQGVSFTLLKDLEEAVQYGLDWVMPRRREPSGEKEKG